VAKPTIEMLCKKHKINHIIDPSNKDNTTSKRNVLRNEVLPKLYNMAHKNTKTENTFRTSMRNIYNEVSSQKKEKINIKTYDPHPLFPQNKIQVYN
jgi:tRNA(Ile)-lysidine synthase TilS/MesJ